MTVTARSIALCLAAILLAACTRPLTDNEAALARDVFGDQIDTAEVRVAKDLGLVPPPRSARVTVERKRVVPGASPCTREPTPPRQGPPAGFAVWNTMFLQAGIYQADAGLFWPDGLVVPQTFVFVHELVHVWQWQNRATTGYAPWFALSEGLPGRDAYFYDPGTAPRFEDFGYEQQASIIEDYLCHLFLDPDAPRRAELRDLLAPVLPVDRWDAAVDGAR